MRPTFDKNVRMPDNGCKNYLLIEDDDEHAHLLGIGLKRIAKTKYKLQRATCLTAALERIKNENWDLIFLDLGLPESTGIETLKTVTNQHTLNLPIIVLTSSEDDSIAEAAIREGALDFMTKSFTDKGTLGRCIRNSTERWQQRCDNEHLRLDLLNFAHTAAHDLKAPLNNIGCFITLLEDELSKGELTTKAKQYLEILEQNSEDSFRIVDDLLSFSKFGAKAISKEPIPFSVIVDKATRQLESTIQNTQAYIAYSKLPTLEVDSELMTHVMQNLLSNSIKYRSAAKPKILIHAEEKDNEFEISVSDNGVGIPNNHLTTIFEPFKSISSPLGEKSSGLGLSICQRVVEAHSGKIWATSTQGMGSTFTITLPKYEQQNILHSTSCPELGMSPNR